MQISMRNLFHNHFFKIHPHILHRGSPELKVRDFFIPFLFIFSGSRSYSKNEETIDEIGENELFPIFKSLHINKGQLYFLSNNVDIRKENPIFELH
mgnify:CR=1 FL=1